MTDGSKDKVRSRGFVRAVLAIVAVYTTVMYLVPCAWLSGDVTRAAVSLMSRVIPMLREASHSSGYSDCYGTFVAGFWLMSPVFGFMGYRSMMNLSPQPLARIRANGWLGYVLVVPMAVLCFLFFFCNATTPGVASLVFNESSSFLPLRIVSWCGVAFAVYFVGLAAGSLRVKFS